MKIKQIEQILQQDGDVIGTNENQLPVPVKMVKKTCDNVCCLTKLKRLKAIESLFQHKFSKIAIS